MVSRRLIRIKAFQVLFAYYKSEQKNIVNAQKELIFSINKTYELYHLILALLLEIRDKFEEKIERAKQKKLPTPEDLNPNTKFIDNLFFKKLRNTEAFERFVDTKKISWKDNSTIVNKLLKQIEDEEFFQKYMHLPTNYKDDKKVIINIVEKILPEFEGFEEYLEDESIYWNDEFEFVLSMVIRTIEKTKELHEEAKILPLWKAGNDKEYAEELIKNVILKHDEVSGEIFKYIKNWDPDRIAFADLLLMEMAYIELTNFQEIPVKVTLNEYIEIAKYYSTKQSGTFINGILDKLIKDLTKKDLIKKSGLGLKE